MSCILNRFCLVRKVRVCCCSVGPDFWCQVACRWVIVLDTVVLRGRPISPVVYGGFRRSFEYGGSGRFSSSLYGVPLL